jgi:hypothetical protein
LLTIGRLEPLEGFERFPVIGGQVNAVAVAPQLGADEAGSRREQPRPIATWAIGDDKLSLPLRLHLELPKTEVAHAKARAPFNV